MKDARDVILEPVISEKAFALLEQNVYTFKVHPSSSKPEIANAVEEIFDVHVLNVNTLRRKGKRIRNRRRLPTAAGPTPSGPWSPSPRATRSNCSRCRS